MLHQRESVYWLVTAGRELCKMARSAPKYLAGTAWIICKDLLEWWIVNAKKGIMVTLGLQGSAKAGNSFRLFFCLKSDQPFFVCVCDRAAWGNSLSCGCQWVLWYLNSSGESAQISNPEQRLSDMCDSWTRCQIPFCHVPPNPLSPIDKETFFFFLKEIHQRLTGKHVRRSVSFTLSWQDVEEGLPVETICFIDLLSGMCAWYGQAGGTFSLPLCSGGN